MRNRQAEMTALAILIIALLTGCSQTLLPKRDLPARKDHWTTTDDGWTLHLWRYRPKDPSADRCPVVLCHGLSHNNTFWDLTRQQSLARYLQQRGFDVWSVSLRGAGESTKPTLSQIRQLFRLNVNSLRPGGLLNRQTGLLKLNWTVDDHIRYDVPAVLKVVCDQSGHRQVHWVGHSMGAMIMFAHLGMNPHQQRVRTFVAVAGPMYHIRPANDVFELLASQSDVVKIGNLATGANLRAIFGTLTGPYLATPIDDLFVNRDNVEPGVLNLLYHQCEEDISPGQLDQLLQYVETGRFLSADGKTDYTALLDRIRTPVFQLVGRLDNMVAPGFAAVVQDRLGSDDKHLRVFGRINGCHANYGHDDIIIGRHARSDVFGTISGWLLGHPAEFPATQPATQPSKLKLPDLRKLLPGTRAE